MPTADAMTASLPYLRPDLGTLHVEFTARILGDDLLDRREVRIANGRVADPAPSLKREGFQLVSHRCPVVEERLDELLIPKPPTEVSPALNAYRDETVPLILALSGARDVLPLNDSNVRYSRILNKAGAMTPAGWPHIDYDREEAEVQLREALALNKFSPAPYSRFVLYQGWRVLSPPPQDYPLAMCDGRTVEDRDIVPIDYHMETATRDVTYKSSGARHSADHLWWYYPDMMPDEMLVFVGFDSVRNDNYQPLHVAIEDRTHAKPVPRISIESRYFALFE